MASQLTPPKNTSNLWQPLATWRDREKVTPHALNTVRIFAAPVRDTQVINAGLMLPEKEKRKKIGVNSECPPHLPRPKSLTRRRQRVRYYDVATACLPPFFYAVAFLLVTFSRFYSWASQSLKLNHGKNTRASWCKVIIGFLEVFYLRRNEILIDFWIYLKTISLRELDLQCVNLS